MYAHPDTVCSGAKENVRDYSGHMASHYLKIQKAEESGDLSE